MPRVIPLNTRRDLYDPETDIIAVALVTITHPDLEDPIRLSGDNAVLLSEDPDTFGTISNGLEYQHILMEAVLPDDEAGATGRARLNVFNVPGLPALLRSFTEPAQAKLAIVFAAAPDHEVFASEEMNLVEANYDEQSVSFELTMDFFFDNPWSVEMTPQYFPALFPA